MARRSRFGPLGAGGMIEPRNLVVIAVLLMALMYFMCNKREGFSSQGMDLQTIHSMAQQQPVMVLVHAPWCGHCKAMMPEWNKVRSQPPPGVHVVTVNSDEQPQLTQALGAQGFPTILGFPKGATQPVSHNGGRTAGELTSFAGSL